MNDGEDEHDEIDTPAQIPETYRDLRACLVCKLVKQYEQVRRPDVLQRLDLQYSFRFWFEVLRIWLRKLRLPRHAREPGENQRVYDHQLRRVSANNHHASGVQQSIPALLVSGSVGSQVPDFSPSALGCPQVHFYDPTQEELGGQVAAIHGLPPGHILRQHARRPA
jgi:hypothetical protein